MAPAPVDHDARRADLTAVLLQVIATHGLEGASIRSLAAAAGVSIGAVQHYFASKEDLLLLAYRRASDDQAARAEQIVAAARSARTAIRDVLIELLPLDPRRTAEARVQLAFAARAMTEPALASELAADLAKRHSELAAAFAELGAAAPARQATLAIAVVDGLATHLLFAHDTVTPDDAIRALDTYLAGATRRKARP